MSQNPLLERRSPLGIPYALLVLMVIFFFMPSAFRAARLSLEKKENNVKDWLPSDFPETAELEWFADHFVGESFVLATWDGCVSGDQRLRLFEQKLRHESETFDATSGLSPQDALLYPQAKLVGRELGLLRSSNDFLDWGGPERKMDQYRRSPMVLHHPKWSSASLARRCQRTRGLDSQDSTSTWQL